MEDHYESLSKISININVILALIILSNMWYFYVLSKNYEINTAKIMEKTAVIEKEIVVSINKPSNQIIKEANDIEDLRDYILAQFPKVLERDVDIISTEINKQCLKHGVAFSLIAGLIDVESSYNKFAKSGKDSHGLMQIRYKVWGPKLGIKQRRDLYRIKVNLNLGIGILKYYIDQNEGNVTKALQNYNGTCGKEFPNKVHQAVKKFNSFRYAYENSSVNEKNVCVQEMTKPNTAKAKINGSNKDKKQYSSKLGKRKRLPSSPIVQHKHKVVHG